MFALQAHRAIKDAGGMANVFGKLNGVLDGAKMALESVGESAASGISPRASHFTKVNTESVKANKSVEGLKREMVFTDALSNLSGMSGGMFLP